MTPIQTPIPNHDHFDGATKRMSVSVCDSPAEIFTAILVESVDLWFKI